MYKELTIAQRTIMTPGPVEAHPAVLQAMTNRILGQFDPNFLAIMDEVKEMIKQPFGTKNKEAFAIDGTSRADRFDRTRGQSLDPSLWALCFLTGRNL